MKVDRFADGLEMPVIYFDDRLACHDPTSEWALLEIKIYFDTPPEPGTAQADRFDILTDLIETCENKDCPI